MLRIHPSLVPTLVGEEMTFFDLHSIDPYETRYKVIATLVLLSELGLLRYSQTTSITAGAPSRPRCLPPKRSLHRTSRLVRPPRSC